MASFIPDNLEQDGAHMLAAKIRRYWAKQDLYPTIQVSPVYLSQSPSAAERPIWVIRSNMVGGRPNV